MQGGRGESAYADGMELYFFILAVDYTGALSCRGAAHGWRCVAWRKNMPKSGRTYWFHSQNAPYMTKSRTTERAERRWWAEKDRDRGTAHGLRARGGGKKRKPAFLLFCEKPSFLLYIGNVTTLLQADYRYITKAAKALTSGGYMNKMEAYEYKHE